MSEMNWNDLKFVLAIARAATLVGAAQALDVSERTVARRLRFIEERLKAQLFNRSVGKWRPTEMGAMVIESAERVETESQALEHRVSGADLRAVGRVRLTAVPVLLNRLLIPHIGALTQQHPELQLELVAEPKNLNLGLREADVALRMGRPIDETRMITRRIGRIDYAVYGKASDNPNTLNWINYEEGMRDLPQAQWITEITQKVPGTLSAISVNDTEAVLAAIRAGLGKSLLPTHVGEEIAELVRLQAKPVLSRDVWILLHPDLRHLARIRAVVNWLDEVMEKI